MQAVFRGICWEGLQAAREGRSWVVLPLAVLGVAAVGTDADVVAATLSVTAALLGAWVGRQVAVRERAEGWGAASLFLPLTPRRRFLGKAGWCACVAWVVCAVPSGIAAWRTGTGWLGWLAVWNLTAVWAMTVAALVAWVGWYARSPWEAPSSLAGFLACTLAGLAGAVAVPTQGIGVALLPGVGTASMIRGTLGGEPVGALVLVAGYSAAVCGILVWERAWLRFCIPTTHLDPVRPARADEPHGKRRALALHAMAALALTWLLWVCMSPLLPHLSPVASAVLFRGGAFILPGMAVAIIAGLDFEDAFSLRPCSGRVLLGVVFLAPAVYILLGEGILVLLRLWGGTYKFEDAGDVRRYLDHGIAVAVFGLAVLPAVAEEFLFRGMMLSGLRNSLGRMWAVIATAMAFGILHSPWPKALATACLGLYFGILVVWSRTLWPALAAHLVNNLLAVADLHGALPWVGVRGGFSWASAVAAGGFLVLGGALIGSGRPRQVVGRT